MFCGAEFASNAMARHLSACPERRAAIEKADQTARQSEVLYHLRVQDADRHEFWLHLEMRGSRTLQDLDKYLRAIWLECCGHLSQFSIGGWGGTDIAKKRRVDEVFAPGVEVTHLYDFGTTSDTRIRFVEARTGKPLTAKPIFLMARNLMPEDKCIVCGQPGTRVCIDCLSELGEWRTLCEEHAPDHEHGEFGELLPLVNSPRLGMCGYTGPAEPPY